MPKLKKMAVRDVTQHPGFQRWFEGSHAVANDGRPLVAFHGTTKDFDQFQTQPHATEKQRSKKTWAGELGSWFAAPSKHTGNYDPGNAEYVAESFTEDRRPDAPYGAYKAGARVLPVHLSIKDPAEFEGYEHLMDEAQPFPSWNHFRTYLESKGHDGVVVRNSMTDGDVDRDDWVAFHPHQIKSVYAQEFDSHSPQIHKAEDLAKAGDTIAALLTHPDPVERALALTLAHVTPAHIAIAEKDPHPRVQASVARWKLKHTPPERAGDFTITHGQTSDENGPARMAYFHASPEQSHALGVHGHDFSRYSHRRFRHLGHFAPDILGYARYSGEPERGEIVVHEVHAPWHLSPAMRGVYVGSWLNRTLGTEHDLGLIEGEGQSQISDLAHHGVEHRVFAGQDPEQAISRAFLDHVTAKGAKSVLYRERPFNKPEGLKKDIGYVTFPKLGVDKVPTKPMTITPGPQHQSRMKQDRPWLKDQPAIFRERVQLDQELGAGAMSNSYLPETPTPNHLRFIRGYVLPGSSGGSRTLHGIENHEAQHSVFAKVAQEYGHKFRERIALKLINHLTDDEKDTLDQMMSVSGYGWYTHPEEGITTHQNYLTDPKWREHVHSTLAFDSTQARHMHNRLKRTWKKLRARAALLTPQEIIGP